MSANNNTGGLQSANVQLGVSTKNSGEWTTGLYDCFDDSDNCYLTFCCPSITFGRNAEIIDRGKTSSADAARIYYILRILGCALCYSFPYRTEVRKLFALNGNSCGDFVVHCCCHPCALCQEHRELKNRGLDPNIGWAANVAKMNQNGKVPPAVVPGMTR